MNPEAPPLLLPLGTWLYLSVGIVVLSACSESSPSGSFEEEPSQRKLDQEVVWKDDKLEREFRRLEVEKQRLQEEQDRLQELIERLVKENKRLKNSS